MVQRGRGLRRGRNTRGRVGRRGRGRLPRSAFNSIKANAALSPRVAGIDSWSPITVQRLIGVTNSTTFSVGHAYIYDALLAQLGITATAINIAVRYMAVELYDLAGRPMQISIYDPATLSGIVGTAVDFPGRSTWSRAKLVWPRSQSANSFQISESSTGTIMIGAVGVPFGDVPVSSTQVLLKVHLLWRNEQNSTGQPTCIASASVATVVKDHNPILGRCDKVVEPIRVLNDNNTRNKRSSELLGDDQASDGDIPLLVENPPISD